MKWWKRVIFNQVPTFSSCFRFNMLFAYAVQCRESMTRVCFSCLCRIVASSASISVLRFVSYCSKRISSCRSFIIRSLRDIAKEKRRGGRRRERRWWWSKKVHIYVLRFLRPRYLISSIRLILSTSKIPAFTADSSVFSSGEAWSSFLFFWFFRDVSLDRAIIAAAAIF